ncbi:hypothetical protein OIU79_018209 [Salix purpurea]|uniref:Uncharacterized protein n=1 Tax=Salix purpurea TaxID=77065 RepID=A0A9Q0WWU3_SALPP|nr:hypothetical protein OIU79_018209 [Salix purpurea]
MNNSDFTVNKKFGEKRANFDPKRSRKLKTATRQEINRKNSFSEKKVQNRTRKDAKQAEKLSKQRN